MHTRKDDFNILQKYILGKAAINQSNQVFIADFYNYVFENKAEVKPVKHIASKKPVKTEKEEKSKKRLSPDEIQQRKFEEKQFQLNSFKDTLGKAILGHPDFRKMLRQVNAEALEIFLFGNTDDALPSDILPKYAFPSDKEIRSIFESLNAIHQFYDKDSKFYGKAADNFVVLFKACKLIADYVENNNDENNAVAAMHAYKILVLFNRLDATPQSPFANFEDFLKIYNANKQPNPIHDTLVTGLPSNKAYKIKDLAGWQKLIQKYGFKAINCFQRADDIERILGKAPSTLKQASEILAKVSYQHYDEYPALADLCIQYNVSEENYNKCLEIRKNIKGRDNLPDKSFDVDGASISSMCEGYYLAKLPIDDPRAYILGHITNCCQSVGGESEQCVMDGITLANNGFYVLLKKNGKTSAGGCRLEDGSINYKEFDIVGQGYAWLSRDGNMTFDSWENLRAGESMTSCALLKLPDKLVSSTFPEGMPSVFEFLQNNLIKNVLILFRENFYYTNISGDNILDLSDKINQEIISCFNVLKNDDCKNADETMLSYVNAALGNSNDDAISVQMLTKFGEVVAASTDIFRVAIGHGGKTPAEFKRRDKILSPEKMAEGHQYGDSKKQSIVYFNQAKQQKMMDEVMAAIKTNVPEKIANKLGNLVVREAVVNRVYPEIIRDLASSKNYDKLWDTILFRIDVENKKTLHLFVELNVQTWRTLYLLHKANDLNLTSYQMLEDFTQKYARNDRWDIIAAKRLAEHHDSINEVIQILNDAGLYTHDIFGLLLKNAKDCEPYAKLLKQLANNQLLSADYIDRIVRGGEQAVLNFPKAFDCLQASSLMTRSNIECLLLEPKNAGDIASILTSLHAQLSEALKESLNQKNPSGFFSSAGNKLSANTSQKLLDYLKGADVEFNHDEASAITSSVYAGDCKKLIANGYPMPKEIHGAFSLSAGFTK
jgi:hypothetical protein